jgi:hypothetical protein
MKTVLTITAAILSVALLAPPAARADGVGTVPPTFNPVITDTLVGTDTDSVGDTFHFNLTVEIGPEGLSLLPTEWAAYWGGRIDATGPNCSPTGCHDLFSSDGAGFFPYGTPDTPFGPAIPNQRVLWSWGDFACTKRDLFGTCDNGLFEYNLTADQYGAEIEHQDVLTSVVGVVEPSALALLLTGLALAAALRRRYALT